MTSELVLRSRAGVAYKKRVELLKSVVGEPEVEF